MGRFDLRFDSIETHKEALQLQNFLLQHSGSYDPDTYVPWVIDTCIPDIKAGNRRSFAWWQRGVLIADAIIKTEQDVALLRHFRVESPDFAHRGLGAFALRQVLPVAIDLLDEQGLLTSETTSVTVRLDTKQESDAAHFFAHHGFEIVDQIDLYGSGEPDIIMERTYPIEPQTWLS